MRVVTLLFIFLILSTISYSQKISRPEKWWALTHPFVFKKAHNITKKVQREVVVVKKERALKGVGNGDQLDAFRHAFWMASLVEVIGEKKARKLGKAHEKGNYIQYKRKRKEEGVVPDAISSQMDLYNNEVGIDLSKINQDKTSLVLKVIVINSVLEGKCKVIKKDEALNYLDINGVIIPHDSLKGKWENDKCLVNSY